MENYDTLIKQKSREKELSFFEKNIDKFKESRDKIKVFCFPFTSPTKALEITDVFDRLGIKRDNIIGIERIKERYEYLKNFKNLGIELFCGEARDIFRTLWRRRFRERTL